MPDHHEREDDDSNATGIAMPKWFVRIAATSIAVFMAICLPWGTWVTSEIMANSQRLDEIRTNSERIGLLERTTSETTTQLQVIAATRFTTSHGESLRDGIEAKLDRLDERLGSLQRDFDRQFGRHGVGDAAINP